MKHLLIFISILLPLSLSAVPIKLEINQQSSVKIQYIAKDANIDISESCSIKDFELTLNPQAGQYFLEYPDINPANISFYINQAQARTTKKLDTLLDMLTFINSDIYTGHIPYYIRYNLIRTYTWANLLHLDDTIHLSLTFYDFYDTKWLPKTDL